MILRCTFVVTVSLITVSLAQPPPNVNEAKVEKTPPAQNVGQKEAVPAQQPGGANAANPSASKRSGKEKHMRDYPGCQEDIGRHCKHLEDASDIALLECLQDVGDGETSHSILAEACENLLYDFKVNLTKDDRFSQQAHDFCPEVMQREDVRKHCAADANKSGHLLSCLLEFKTTITKGSKCYKFLSRVEQVAFSDFRLISPFIDACQTAIKTTQCGRLDQKGVLPNVPEVNKDGKQDVKGMFIGHSSQGGTLECLVEKLIAEQDKRIDGPKSQIDEKCRHQVMRMAELQSNDYHADRPLYFACRDDREQFCAAVQVGDGKVFQCLLEHKHDQKMNPLCVHYLNIREQLMGQDAQMAHPLMDACEKDIVESKCSAKDQNVDVDHYYLTYLMLCMEGYEHKAEKPLTPECRHEMTSYRQLVINDFQLSPEILLSCGQNIVSYCGGLMDGEEQTKQGSTMHCLMNIASHGKREKPPRTLDPVCERALASAVEVADLDNDIETGVVVDHVLAQSCQTVITERCHDTNTQFALLQCLMANLEDNSMTDDCEDRLLEIQYFLARDWSLDPKLVRACNNDAKKICGSNDKWWEHKGGSQNVPSGPNTMACLYRNAYNDVDLQLKDERIPGQLSSACAHEMHRVMRERAARVSLQPELEEKCRGILAEHCSHDTGDGAEMQCLMEFVGKEYEGKDVDVDLDPCAKEVMKIVQHQSVDYRLNYALERACRPTVAKHCSELASTDIDDGEIIQCLLKHRQDPDINDKCHTYIDHYELISMRDYHLTPKFAKACKMDIKTHCKGRPTDKTSTVHCLSHARFLATVIGQQPPLTDNCSKQLKKAYLDTERVEAKANVELFRACKQDIKQLQCYGGDTGHTSEDVIECLRENKEKIKGKQCRSLIFTVQEDEALDNSLDTHLMAACKNEMATMCQGARPDRKLKCLKKHRKNPDMSEACLTIVKERMHESAHDIRLQPGLLQACKREVAESCPDEDKLMNSVTPEQHEMEGAVVACLRKVITDRSDKVRASVSEGCSNEVHRLILESEFDPQMDLPFYQKCKEELTKNCGDQLSMGGTHDDLHDCMKAVFYSQHMEDKACREEIARRTSEELSDIELDPLLAEACSSDIQHNCNRIRPGGGRLITCLIGAMDSPQISITDTCRARLVDRRRMWDMANKEFQVKLPQSVSDFVRLAMDSPASSSILTYLVIFLLVLFACGLCCGRATKRARLEHKIR